MGLADSLPVQAVLVTLDGPESLPHASRSRLEVASIDHISSPLVWKQYSSNGTSDWMMWHLEGLVSGLPRLFKVLQKVTGVLRMGSAVYMYMSMSSL